VWIDTDDRLMASEVKVWAAATGRERATFKGHTDNVLALALTLDGKMLATASADKTVKLWNLATGKEVATLKGHADAVTSLAFTADGKLLATGSQDATIKLWDMPKTE